MGNLIALGDVEGYVHLLNREDGSFAARLQLEDSAIMPQMLAVGASTIIAQTRKGGIYAISIK
jgi:outer membrane protein assembly factor BamB